MKFWRKGLLFYLGGCAYVGLELAWRGRSHGSMFAAGGLSFVLLGSLDRRCCRLPGPLRWLLGAMAITLVELATGLAVNRSYSVWDYRDRPLNFMGQICPLFTLLWVPLAGVAMAAHRRLERALSAKLRP